MPTVITDLLQSKKFVFTLVVTALLLVASKLGAITNEEMQTFFKYLWPAYLGAQGLADLGKGAAKAKAAASNVAAITSATSASTLASVAVAVPVTETEEKKAVEPDAKS